MSKNVTDRTGKLLSIDEFKLSEMCINPSIIMIAKRGSGKSWVARAILDHFHKVPAGIIIAPTDRMNPFYGNYFPSTYIHYKWDAELVEGVLARQIKLIEKALDRAKEGKHIDARAFIIMDDCLGRGNEWKKSEAVHELLFNGRHYQLMYILTMQTPLGIGPDLRSNFDYVFLLATDIMTDMKKMHEHYAGMFPNLTAFKQVFSQLTSDFGCMVVINRGTRTHFLEKIKWYKAPNLEDEYINYGCRQFRKYHKENYDKNWMKRNQKFSKAEEMLDRKSKSRSTIGVNKISRD